MKDHIRAHSIYFLFYAIFLAIAGSFLYHYDTSSIHLYMNRFYSPFTDFIFPYITFLGDGMVVSVVVIISLFYRKIWALQIGVTGVLSGFLAQILKRFVFGPIPRPSAFFQELGIQLHRVDGIELHTAYSFPSGHSTTIFALTTSLVILLPNRRFDSALLGVALVVGYSRIYLSQHFLEDVFAGSLLGVGTALMVYYIILISGLVANPKWNLPLISVGRNKN